VARYRCVFAFPGIRGQVSRNTLASANATRDWRIYADFAQRLIGIARKLYINEPFGVDLANIGLPPSEPPLVSSSRECHNLQALVSIKSKPRIAAHVEFVRLDQRRRRWQQLADLWPHLR
jgi:hypothetical protein